MFLTFSRPDLTGRTRSAAAIGRTLPAAPSRGVLLATAALGAAAVYLLDPVQGARRRNTLRDRTAAIARRARATTGRQARRARGQAKGVIHRLRQTRPQMREYDDVTLARKVESEIFRGADAPKGSVNVSVENGVVVLRGRVEHEEDVERLERQARRVVGVYDVDNLLQASHTRSER